MSAPIRSVQTNGGARPLRARNYAGQDELRQRLDKVRPKASKTRTEIVADMSASAPPAEAKEDAAVSAACCFAFKVAARKRPPVRRSTRRRARVRTCDARTPGARSSVALSAVPDPRRGEARILERRR
jgi:hypothetical protein